MERQAKQTGICPIR